jgi:hypothetical protein
VGNEGQIYRITGGVYDGGKHERRQRAPQQERER